MNPENEINRLNSQFCIASYQMLYSTAKIS